MMRAFAHCRELYANRQKERDGVDDLVPLSITAKAVVTTKTRLRFVCNSTVLRPSTIFVTLLQLEKSCARGDTICLRPPAS